MDGNEVLAALCYHTANEASNAVEPSIDVVISPSIHLSAVSAF